MAAEFNLIAKAELTSTTAFTYAAFTSIPSTYTDLKLVASIRSDRAAADTLERLYVYFNNDSSNISEMQAIQTGGSTYSDTYTNGTAGLHHNNNAPAGVFGLTEMLIHNYASTSLTKMCSVNSTGGYVPYVYQYIQSHLWNSTSAINSIYISGLGSNLLAYSNFYLYGISKS